MSKVRKGKQIAAVVMAVALSAAMVTTRKFMFMQNKMEVYIKRLLIQA